MLHFPRAPLWTATEGWPWGVEIVIYLHGVAKIWSPPPLSLHPYHILPSSTIPFPRSTGSSTISFFSVDINAEHSTFWKCLKGTDRHQTPSKCNILFWGWQVRCCVFAFKSPKKCNIQYWILRLMLTDLILDFNSRVKMYFELAGPCKVTSNASSKTHWFMMLSFQKPWFLQRFYASSFALFPVALIVCWRPFHPNASSAKNL